MPSTTVTSYNILSAEQIDRQQWSALLDNSRTATWFQSPEAYDFFASLHEMMTPFAFGLVRRQDQTEHLRAVCVGYITKEPNAVKQFFTRRTVIFGGPCLADDCTSEECRTLTRAIRGFNEVLSIFIETRNFNDYSSWRSAFEAEGFAYQPHYDLHTDCTDRRLMTSRVADSTMRQVRKALAEGVHIVEAQTDEDIEAFYLLLSDLYRKKVRKPLFPLSFFTRFVRQGRGVLLLAKRPLPNEETEQRQDGVGKEEVIGGMLCAILPARAIYEWYVVGTAVVTWAAMDYANNHGLHLFDLMGAGVPDIPYGVRDFKMRFGGQLHEYGRFLHVNNRLLYALGKAFMRIIQLKK